ncbi:MAG: class I SAM-dependent methyltransferase [Prolixibacteraceae bacterium]|nr:class I SAM-dependent methyltransferase [Burkholderiales bacterium]
MKISEFSVRVLSPTFLTSGICNVIANSWHGIVPSEYSRRFRIVRPYTMMSNARLRALHDATARVIAAGVPGVLVECGTAKGGSAAMMALVVHECRSDKRIWVFDCFEGMPPPTENDPDRDLAANYVGDCLGTFEEVSALFAELGVSDRMRMVKGLFQETLPPSSTGDIALLHIDGDWYDSVMSCLTSLYDRVPPGGIIQLDDYGYWQGARKAVNDFFKLRGEPVPALKRIDHSGRQFTKAPRSLQQTPG